MSFTGKVVLITGASSGIGAETARHFASLGASLAIVARNVEKLNDCADSCAKISSKRPLVIVADVTKDAERIIDTTVAHFNGQLDVLVNNAGAGFGGPLESSTLEQFDEAMNVNVRSVFHLTKLAIPHLLKTKGNVVNVSSVAGLRSFAGFLPYSMAKAALDQFTKCVALELADRGVRVNSVNPAVIVTEFQRNMGMPDEATAKILEDCKTSHAMGRPGQPSEVAAAIAFLADEACASFITGTLLAVDGGKAIMCPR